MYLLYVLVELLCFIDCHSSERCHVPSWPIFSSVVSYFILPATVFRHIHNAQLQKMRLFYFPCLTTFNNLQTAEQSFTKFCGGVFY